jgi:hypothetical protein
VALKLEELLIFNGIGVSLSRRADIACGGATTNNQDVTNQINFANNSNSDIAIAIHFNSASPFAHGTEVLYTNYPSRNEDEIKLAQLLLNELVACNGLTNRGLKETPSGVGVIKKVFKPTVLSECCFISNESEKIWCSDPFHNWLLAEAHAKAVCKFFGIEYKEYPKLENIKIGVVDMLLQWQKDLGNKAIDSLVEKGLLQKSDSDGWKGKLEGYPQNWLFFEMMNRLCKL